MQMRSFQHAWGMRNGNGTNGIKLCFSKEEGRKEGSGQDFIVSESNSDCTKVLETIPFLFLTYLGISTMLGF